MKEFHRGDFANRTGLAQAWTVKSADRLFTDISSHISSDILFGHCFCFSFLTCFLTLLLAFLLTYLPTSFSDISSGILF